MATAHNTPRDVFLYLLAIVALVMTAVNLGTLLFQFINLYVPDALAHETFYREGSYGTIRWTVATLVIVFPVLVWVWRFLRRDIAQFPEKRELKIRKWLLYLTLFVAGVVVIGDLIALVYNFLQGELTTRFGLKIVTVFAIAGSIFWHYLGELHGRAGETSHRLFIWLVAVVVAVSVVSGFAVAGSPMSRRTARFDEQRVMDLQSIQWQIVSFWQGKTRLPGDLEELRNDISGYVAPQDPVTDQGYGYQTTSSLSFRLCAQFQTDTSADTVPKPAAPREWGQNWVHPAGEYCFTRTIDPQLYPPLDKAAPVR